MQAIETKYKGHNFRSRLEARWAVFFDALGVKYEYEPEGISLRDGTNYLPDFYVHDFGGGGYFEVKPDTKIEQAWIDKLELLCLDSGSNCFLLNGVPDFKYYSMVTGHEGSIANWCAVAFCGGDLGNMNTYGTFVNPFGWQEELEEDWFWRKYVDAVYAARSARFEHGQSGATI